MMWYLGIIPEFDFIIIINTPICFKWKIKIKWKKKPANIFNRHYIKKKGRLTLKVSEPMNGVDSANLALLRI